MSLIHITTLVLLYVSFIGSLFYINKIEQKHKKMIRGLHEQFLYLKDKLPKE